MNNNPIYIVDDDRDEEVILLEAMQELGLSNKMEFYHTAEELLDELKVNPVVPFIIISDINLPRMDGFELRSRIMEQADIIEKSIPFIFWSTTASSAQVKKAFEMSVHGFFIKGRNYQDIKEGLNDIIHYWSRSLAPTP